MFTVIHCFIPYILTKDEGRSEGRLFSRNTLLPPASVGPSSPLVRKKKKRDLLEVMEEEAQELLSYFNHRNVDALLRLTRNTLEMLRKRIHASSLVHFSGGSWLAMLLLSALLLFLTIKQRNSSDKTCQVVWKHLEEVQDINNYKW